VADYESGKAIPSAFVIQKLNKALGLALKQTKKKKSVWDVEQGFNNKYMNS